MLSPTPIDRPSLHPGTGYLITPRVPHGLAAVVEGLTREVLRHRPEDIYVFAAHHFEKLLKLREQYQTEEYSDRQFNHEFSCDFNLWPTKESRNIRKFSNGWSLEKEIEILEGRRKVPTDVEESPEDVSTDKENRKVSKQMCSRGSSTMKKSSRKSKDETTSDVRTTRIISQMSAFHGPGKSIQTKDIKQELRKNKLSGEKSKTSDGGEKGIQGQRRSKTKVSKTDKGPEKEVERATMTTRTTSRKPLKKVRRIETESETETERETAKVENGQEKSNIRLANIKSDGTSRKTMARAGSRERRSEARFSEHSSERKVSSRALSMDRIRAYVLRKFASTASLEVLRSPTYVEQVQEVIDRAAPIIKERLEEIRRPRGKRSRSVDLAWNEESFYQHVRDRRRRDGQEEIEKDKREKDENRLEWKTASKEDAESSVGEDETILSVEREEKKSRRRSAGSGKKSKRRENSGQGDFGTVDEVDNSSKHSGQLEPESSATRDTLEARLTATQSILEDISKSTSELNGARRAETAGSEASESEVSDHVNVVSLPIVRPPSSRNSRNATKNGSDSLTLPPISPEAPKSTKKKDELSLPVLSTATNSKHSAKKSQEQDISKEVDEASTMRDITSDIEDIAVLPEDGHVNVIINAKQDPSSDHQDSISDIKSTDEEKREKDMDEIFGESIPEKLAEKRGSLEEFEKLEERRLEEVFKDSLNVTPEVVDVPLRPDSLESNQDEVKLQEDNADLAQGNTFDGLKDKLIEIEMMERDIEKALVSQQVAMYDDSEVTSQTEKSMTDGKINVAGKSVNETEETVSEVRKLTDVEKISTNKDDDEREKRTLTNEMEKVKDIKISMNKTENLNAGEKSINKIEKLENKVEKSISEAENLTNETKTSANKVTKTNEVEILKNEMDILRGVEKAMNRVEIPTIADGAIKVVEDEKSMNRTESSIQEKVLNGVEELAIKVHVEKLQSVNPRLQGKENQIIEVIACKTDDDNTTTSKEKAESTNESSTTTDPGNAATEGEMSLTNIPSENSRTKVRKKRDIDKLTTTLPSEVPFSYVLSEGSPCEIPDSVTTVIIPDRPCPSPVILEDEDYQFGLMNKKEESLICSNVSETQEKNRHESDIEVFGEYIRPEVAVLPVDIDFVRGVKGTKPSQDIVIAHQDLDRIKEEGEEEEKGNAEEKEVGSHQEKKDDKQVIAQDETTKLVGTLEDIVEHEENEEIDTGIIFESKDAEEISSLGIPESLPNMELMADAGLTNEERTGVTIESKGTIENSSEESGSTQDIRTTTSSDMKESTASNRSVESPSLDRPVVPELNLDSLQDNTVSSFKMTANETTKEDNGSPRESDATTSLIEPLTSDERLMNRLALADHEEEVAAEEIMERDLQSKVPEIDQLYRAEHAEYEWLEKDPLSSEINLEDEMKSQEDSIGLQALPENVVLAGPLLREKEAEEELSSEEEIARELICSLDEDMQLHATKESDLKEESKDSGEPAKSNLDVHDKSNQSPSKPKPLMSVDEQEKSKHEVSSEGVNEIVTTIETISELSSQIVDINQDNKNKDDTIIETEKAEVREKDEMHVAPLAQFEQDELLEQNSKSKIVDDKITEESKPDIINENSTDNQKKSEDKQISIENILENKNIENISKIEDSNGMQKENEQEKFQRQEKNEQQKLESHEECQEKLNNQEKSEQEKSKGNEKYKQEESEIQEKSEQEKLEIQEKGDKINLEQPEEIVEVKATSLEVTELEKNSTNESMRNDDEHEKTKPTIYDEFVSDNQTDKNVKNKKEEKTKERSAEMENVHGPITSEISQQSTGDRSGYWTMDTKSSTVETVIEAFSYNTNIDEKTEKTTVDDALEIIEGESLAQKKDDFYSAVVKIQACIRGFLARRHIRLNSSSKSVSNNVSSMKITANTDDHLAIPSNLQETRSGRQRLRREEALRNTTLSLENAFATSRLQHTGEFHDSVPLPLFDLISDEMSSNSSNESLNKEVEDNTKQANQLDIAKSNANENNSVRDEHKTSFQKGNTFVDPTFPIVMHLLADASRNCHFAVNQNSHSGFNASAGGVKAMEPTMDILMLGYPRDDENRYLNFITSVEDLGTNVDSLPLDDIINSSKTTIDAHPSVISGEGSLREPLALPGTPQGVVIEEVTSLDEAGHFPSESTKLSTAPKTSLDTNTSVPSEVSPRENERDDLRTSPKTVAATEDRKHIDQEAEKQNFNCNLGSDGKSESCGEDTSEKSNEISHDSHERLEEKKNGNT